ncbi:hypothetical protein [Leucobacter komagatae]|uniref:Cell division protein FtsL n=1 Tax=Leucobacter komagatae TaxID=55969 RepID=A0A0D0ISE5_9MICO|nr:hypothetical protein [Leucobacter komagatae]KIP52408.1 hypothetical protein SD72_09265 [Leucobacter komagatae]
MNATVPVEVDQNRLFGAPAPRPEPTRERGDRLRPVTAPAAAPRKSPVVGAIVAVCVILGIFAAQLALSILVSQGAYESRALSIEERDLGRVERVLSQNLDKLASPQNLVENAGALGMVQNVSPATMRLSDGAIKGSLDSATRDAGENLVPNAQLDTLPTIDAKGLLGAQTAAKAPVTDAAAAVAWKGKLPAPETR